MKNLSCTECHRSVPAASTFTVNGQLLCEPCADKRVVEIRKLKGKLEVFRSKDPTICWKCSSDFGSQELPLTAGLHTCEPCRTIILDFQYPAWLKTAAGILVVLLVLSLIHGRSYFVAGNAYYKGKKLLDSGNAKQAVPYFEKAMVVGRDSTEVIANAALAYMKSGRPDEAFKLVKDRKFEKDDAFNALQVEFDRFERAAVKSEEAHKQFESLQYREAAQRMHEAAEIYPEYPLFAGQAVLLDASVAFYGKDYARMVQLAEQVWSKEQNYEAAASLASAYACVYASEGDESMKQKAQAMMDKASAIASSKEDRDDLQEWEPRFNHRIETRQIMDRAAYNAKFRPQLAVAKEQHQ